MLAQPFTEALIPKKYVANIVKIEIKDSTKIVKLICAIFRTNLLPYKSKPYIARLYFLFV